MASSALLPTFLASVSASWMSTPLMLISVFLQLRQKLEVEHPELLPRQRVVGIGEQARDHCAHLRLAIAVRVIPASEHRA